MLPRKGVRETDGSSGIRLLGQKISLGQNDVSIGRGITEAAAI